MRSLSSWIELSLLVALNAIGVRPRGITCIGKADGGGAQVHAVMSVQAFCEAYRLNYLHSPFTRIEHARDSTEIQAWENLLDLGNGFQRVADIPVEVVPLKRYLSDPRLWFCDCVVAMSQAHHYADRAIYAYGGIVERLRKRLVPDNTTDRPQVAVHIRRGNVSATQNAERFTKTEKLVAVTRQVKSAIQVRGLEPQITIYSEGTSEDFIEFAGMACILKLNGDPLDAVRAMASADVLVVAKSSFSYVAALLSSGLVIYEPFWHAPREGWVNMEKLFPCLHRKLERNSARS